MSRYVRVDRGSGSRPGQLLQHASDPNRWQVKAFIGRDAKGRKQYRSEVVYGRKRDAEARLIELLQDKNTGKLTPRSTATLADLVREWIPHKAQHVAARTIAGYEHTLRTYVLPTLGHKRLADLTLRDIDQLYRNMREGKLPKPEADKDGKIAGWQGKPLGPRTVHLAHAALSQALTQAVRWQMISYSPARDAEVVSGKPKEKRALTAAERAAFLEASAGAYYRVLYRVLMDTGLRPGEACALMWTDLDFQNERLTVARAVTRGADGERIATHPKTSKSRRTLPMFGLCDMLLEHMATQREVGHDASGYVFVNQEGQPLAPWTFSRRELDRTLTAAGITDTFSLYSFRHTFASLHLASGTPLTVVSRWLGHSTISQTANTYQHLANEVAEDWAQRHVAYLEKTEKAAASRVAN